MSADRRGVPDRAGGSVRAEVHECEGLSAARRPDLTDAAGPAFRVFQVFRALSLRERYETLAGTGSVSRYEGVPVPLSEDEERILQQIAQRFYEDDPSFAREVSETTLYRHTVRRMKWSVVGFLAGAVFLVAALSTSFWLSFAGFLVMLGCALVFERNLRKLGKAGLDHLASAVRANGLREALGGAGRRVRDRFSRGDESNGDDTR